VSTEFLYDIIGSCVTFQQHLYDDTSMTSLRAV
jgi:hypothetical protein